MKAYVADPSSVLFRLDPAPDAKGSLYWIATYTAEGKTARFRIELESERRPSAHEFPVVSSGVGRFVAQDGSDASALLKALRIALEAKTSPTKTVRATELKFEYANIGEHLSQAEGGGFNSDPPGSWMALKIFFSKDEDESEMFLNIDADGRRAEFSMKDPDYGDMVLAKLAKVL